jgi:hypothetical protein
MIEEPVGRPSARRSQQVMDTGAAKPPNAETDAPYLMRSYSAARGAK